MARKLVKVSKLEDFIKKYKECEHCQRAMFERLKGFRIKGDFISEEDLHEIVGTKEVCRRIMAGINS